jgi:hypothetical protein
MRLSDHDLILTFEEINYANNCEESSNQRQNVVVGMYVRKRCTGSVVFFFFIFLFEK